VEENLDIFKYILVQNYRKEIVNSNYDKYKNNYLKNVKVEDHQLFKEILVKILSNSDYDKYITNFELKNQFLGKDIEQTFWDALSKGKSINLKMIILILAIEAALN
jgi:hypothetical protein